MKDTLGREKRKGIMDYTKGEWEVEPIIKGKTFGIFTEYHRYELARVFIHNGEQEANAYLIASAPDMYEALRVAQIYIAREEIRKGTLGRTRLEEDIIKVLAKAEGKA